MRAIPLSRRQLLLGGLGLAGVGALSACTGQPTGSTNAAGPLRLAPSASPRPGQRVVTATLTARQGVLDLGGRSVSTWAYGDSAPGPVIRATAGDFLRITVHNQLPAGTTVHWHGIRVSNAADGVPGVTQDPIRPDTSYLYQFTAPDPGTYFYHPHVGVQLDRGLYGPLVIDDPHEPGNYDAEWIVVLDDWTDDVGPSPDDILQGYKDQRGTVGPGMNGGMVPGSYPSDGDGDGDGGMGGMGDGGMGGGGTGMGMGGDDTGGSSSSLGDAGDIAYPYYLINGRIPDAPATFNAHAGQRVRIRLINAAADTVFKVALGGHTLNVTHADGYPVVPAQARAVYIGMGERYDMTVTLGSGVFPLVARPEGKSGTAFAVVRTAAGSAPTPTSAVPELDGNALLATQLTAADSVRLSVNKPDRTLDVQLNGQMKPYAWGINGRQYGQDTPLTVRPGQRLRLRMTNMTTMVHPMHIHGHVWGLPASGGLRKDTVLVLPMQTIEADLQADNPGVWAYHCHNQYHAETGMMTTLRYS